MRVPLPYSFPNVSVCAPSSSTSCSSCTSSRAGDSVKSPVSAAAESSSTEPVATAAVVKKTQNRTEEDMKDIWGYSRLHFLKHLHPQQIIYCCPQASKRSQTYHSKHLPPDHSDLLFPSSCVQELKRAAPPSVHVSAVQTERHLQVETETRSSVPQPSLQT